METQLDLLRYMCIDEDVAALQASDLVGSAFVYTLDGRDTRGLVARFHALAAQKIPPRPDNRLRHVACLQVAADLLGQPCAARLSDHEIAAGVAEVAGVDYLWSAFLDLAIALSLRYGNQESAKSFALQRLKAPLADLHTMVQVLHLQAISSTDAMTASDLGYLGALAAMSMAGTAREATQLALVAANGAAWSSAWQVERVKACDGCISQVDRHPLQWSIDPASKGLRATLTVRAVGSLHDCVGSVLEDLVYLWPLHIDRLMNRQLPLNEIRGAKTRKIVFEAVTRGGIEAVLDLQGTTIATNQLAALVERQNAGLSWIRANHAQLSDLPGGIRLMGA